MERAGTSRPIRGTVEANSALWLIQAPCPWQKSLHATVGNRINVNRVQQLWRHDAQVATLRAIRATGWGFPLEGLGIREMQARPLKSAQIYVEAIGIR
eukprot:scaffold324633_cov17-Prasinocladus_malaysianus.AAC.1